jgi:hypothetical protein
MPVKEMLAGQAEPIKKMKYRYVPPAKNEQEIFVESNFRLPLPKSYSEDPKELGEFMCAGNLHFRVFPRKFSLPSRRVAFLVSCL